MSDQQSSFELLPAHLMPERAHQAGQCDPLQVRSSDPTEGATALRRVNRLLRILSNFNRALVRGADEIALLHSLCDTIVTLGGYRLAWVGFRHPDAEAPLTLIASAGSADGAPLHQHWTVTGPEPVASALRTGQPQILRFPGATPELAARGAVAEPQGAGATLALPLMDRTAVGGRVFGCLTLYATEPDTFEGAEVDLLLELTHDLVDGLAALRSQPVPLQAKANLRQSEARLALALAAAQMGIWDWHLPTGEITWSRGHEALFGLAPGSFDGRYETFEGCLHPDDRAALRQAIQQAIAEPGTYYHEFRIVWPDGTLRWMESKGQALYDATGAVVRMTGTVMDISDRRQTAALLHDSQQQYQALADAAPVGIFRVDAQGNCSYVNQRWCHIMQRSLASALGQGWASTLHPEDYDRVYRTWQHAVQSCQMFQAEYRVYRPDGTIVWVFGQIVAETDPTGPVPSYVGTITDITAHKQAEISLQQSEANYRQLFETNPNPMWIFDPETLQFLAVNQAVIAHYGYSSAEFLNMTLLDIRPPEDVPSVLAQKADSTGPERYVGTWRHRKKDGTVITAEVVSHVITWSGRSGRCTTIKDVTAQLLAEREREQTEAALQATTAELKALFAAMTDIVLVRDAQGRCLKVAPTQFQNLYQSAPTLIGTTVAETMPKPQADIILGCIQQALLSGQTVYGEYRLPIANRDVYFSTAFSPMADDAVMLVAHDITHRKRVEDALRQSEEKFRVAFEQSPIAMALIGLDRQYLKLNQAYSYLFGYTPAELMALTFVELTHPDDLALDLAYHEQLVRGEIAYFQIEKRYFHKTGRIIYGLLNVALVTDGHGQTLHVIAQIVDITTRKQAEQVLQEANTLLETRVAQRTASLTQVNHQLQQELQERQAVEQALRHNQELLQAIVDHSPAVIYIHDLANRVLLANRQYSELFQRPVATVIGQPLSAILPPQLAERCADMTAMVLAQARPIETEVLVEASDGPRTYLVIKFPLLNAAGEIYALCGIATDITERTVIARMKDEFMGVVSHELRTPLTVIYAALNLFADGIVDPQSPPGQRAMKIAAANTDRLVRLVNDILDLERLVSGRLSFDFQAWDLADLMIQAMEQLQVMANQAGITLSTIPFAIGLNVDGDRLIQVLTNLLSNAIKFSPRGAVVWLTADRLVEPEQSFIVIQVKDQGRGIAPEQLETIFERFHQVDVSDARQKGGVGLGLPICRNIVQRHGGVIWAESSGGEGSCFYVKLPI